VFPGVDGFHWTFAHIFFVSVFLSIAAALAGIVIASLARGGRDIANGRAGQIRWSLDFAELPLELRQCRHAVTGEAPGRICPNAFDCRHCEEHAKFRQARAGQCDNAACGLFYPNYRYYHRGHTWVTPQKDGTLLVGLDAIGEHMVGKPDSVRMPAPGSRVVTNGEGWRMSKDGFEVRVLAPIDGTVVQTGTPQDGWYLRVQPDSHPPDLRHLLRGEEIEAWVSREIERLQCALSPDADTPLLADGGVLMEEFIREVPAARRDEVLGEMFLEP
jgi:glycine cleavage system H lipoate-binding protein